MGGVAKIGHGAAPSADGHCYSEREARCDAVNAHLAWKACNKRVKLAVKDYWKRRCGTMAAEAQAAHRVGDSKRLYGIVRSLSASRPAKPNMLRLESGAFATSPADIAARWARHHQRKLGGELLSLDEVSRRATTRQCSFGLLASVDRYDLAIVPTECDIVDIMAAGKAGRGHGEDGLCAEIFKELKDIMAPLLWPIWLKMVFRLEEPPPWKGGMLASLYKGKGDWTVCDASRGVLVADAASKQPHAWLRRHMMPTFLRGPVPRSLAARRGPGPTLRRTI